MRSAWSTGRTCLSTRSAPLNQSSTSGLTLCYFFSSPVAPVLSPKYFSAFRPLILKESSQYKLPSISSQYKLPSINFPLYCESFVKIVVTRLSLTFFHLVCWKQTSTHRCSYNSVVEEKSDFLVIELLSTGHRKETILWCLCQMEELPNHSFHSEIGASVSSHACCSPFTSQKHSQSVNLLCCV